MRIIKIIAAFVFIFVTFVFISNAQDVPLSYLALGDSYTIGESMNQSQRWPVQLADAFKAKGISIADPKIIAKTGWTTTELREAIDKATLNPPYDLVSLLIGVNDQYDGLDFEQYPGRFEYLLNKAIELTGGKAKHVLVVSIPDYSVTPFGQEKDPDKIARELTEYNAANQSIAERHGVTYVNITPGSQKALNDSTLIAGDGLHPSGKMYIQWVDQIVPVLFPEIKSWQTDSL